MTEPNAWQTSWAREADKVKALAESLRHTVKERDTWRQRALTAEYELARLHHES